MASLVKFGIAFASRIFSTSYHKNSGISIAIPKAFLVQSGPFAQKQTICPGMSMSQTSKPGYTGPRKHKEA